MKIILRINLLTCLLFISTAYSQYNSNLLKAEEKANATDNSAALKFIAKVDTTALSKPDKAYYTYVKAKILENSGREDEAIQQYFTAKKLFKEADSIEKSIDVNLDIVYAIDGQTNNTVEYLHYITEYLDYNIKYNDPFKMARGYSYMAQYKMRKKAFKESLNYYFKALNLFKETKSVYQEANVYHNIATLYNEHLSKPDSGLYYLKKNADLILLTDSNPYELYHNYVNQASSYRHLGNYNKAIELLLKADKLPIKDNVDKHKQLLYEILHQNYKSINDNGNAYKYLLKEQELTKKINITEQNIAIGNINTKYETLEKELENRELKDKDKINTILVYTLIGLLTASFVIGVLIVKNSRRKEKILHQDKLIEQQRFDKAFKEYELSSIDLILEGQEKERQRIANDLHDNLGSMLATLKLNFENLKMRKKETTEDDAKLYEKTDSLIDEAYQKVRRMAHTKNAGVLANDGLIPAIKRLAEKMSVQGKLQINVIPFGFTDRLDNTLEIAIFRIVQELATNIIKHSQATEATIHLTQHDYNLNIIIEDNGVGMDTSKINFSDGMGLHSITKKTEQLDGTLTIDSTPGRGTTIIIDLPI
ncbi:hypothetical protein GR160_03100 [Flavobacterium sp. Sd200]|uniref:sensor histidine kinase n=1 Tax=Flavobacterium sp. Sd200 TaxID=2692211 RepID=UPI00136A9548|nr:sensor histidine kinase [Flavobacterium sp. Sd200]MXN90202.1 hypothetical protein [Flavobacterium sp. Sd200]